LAVCEILRSRPGGAAIKALLARHSGKSEWTRARLPLRPLMETEREALFRAFDATGIRLRPAA